LTEHSLTVDYIDHEIDWI